MPISREILGNMFMSSFHNDKIKEHSDHFDSVEQCLQNNVILIHPVE